MQDINVPIKWGSLFASAAPAGNVTAPLPTTAQPNGLVSVPTGFQQVNFTPVAGGGVPPWGKDFNGIFQVLTAWQQWQQAGAPIFYDSAFQTEIGGYPANSVVLSALTQGLWWVSTVDNNLTNPDANGAGWLAIGSYTGNDYTAAGTYNLVVPPYATTLSAKVWGGGGGGSGGASPNLGASGAGGGLDGGWFSVTPGQQLTVTVGPGGIEAASGGQALQGGTSSIAITGGANLLLATGGQGGGLGPGSGGTGMLGQLRMQGQGGQDLDGVTPAVYGGSAPQGGFGGVLNAGGLGLPATAPGGGGGANANAPLGQNGAQGGAFLLFQVVAGQ